MCVLAVYIVVVLYVTLLRGGIGFGGFEYRANFKPFSSYKEAWYNFSAQEWRNLILNIFVLERLKERGKYICAGLGLHCL